MDDTSIAGFDDDKPFGVEPVDRRSITQARL